MPATIERYTAADTSQHVAPRVGDLEQINYLGEYQDPAVNYRDVDFWLEPHETYDQTVPLWLLPGEYAAKAYFLGRKAEHGEEEFWTGTLVFHVPATGAAPIKGLNLTARPSLDGVSVRDQDGENLSCLSLTRGRNFTAEEAKAGAAVAHCFRSLFGLGGHGVFRLHGLPVELRARHRPQSAGNRLPARATKSHPRRPCAGGAYLHLVTRIYAVLLLVFPTTRVTGWSPGGVP